MYDLLKQHESQKKKSGRPSELNLEEQILLALTYWREYRTLYHIGMDFGVHESSASRIVRKVEDILIDSGKFALPQKLPSRTDEDANWSVVIVDATETPIERPKKPKTVLLREKEASYLKRASDYSLANRSNTRRANC